MDTSETPSTVCHACGGAAQTICSGCAGDRNITDFVPTPTRYCGKDCQTADWNSHKASCQAVQAKVKLFRAGALLQQAFLATRAEAFDLSIAKIEQAQDGSIHFFDSPSQVGIRPFSSTLTTNSCVKNAVLSYGAGGDTFAGSMYELCKKAFSGQGWEIEEMNVRVFESRVKTYRHFARDPQSRVVDATHSVLRVTLKDGSAWVQDLAGAQHGQQKPVMPFADSDRAYIASILSSREFGTSARSVQSVLKRHPGDLPLEMRWSENQDYQIDELAEWEYHNVAVKELLKAKTDDHQRSKQELIDHLATAAREYVKYALRDPTSTARPLDVLVMNGNTENLSEEDKGRVERKKARKMARMDAGARELYETSTAAGAVAVAI